MKVLDYLDVDAVNLDLKGTVKSDVIPELSPKVYELVLKYGGSTTGEHNDGIIRTPYLPLMFGEKMMALFEETKKIFDPLNIFNPRKKVGATMEYSMNHVRTNF